jgi:hemerythrin-like domain-containing protein
MFKIYGFHYYSMEFYEIFTYEHEIIGKLFSKLNEKLAMIEKSGKVDSTFIEIFSDFFMTYIDVYHHGKEENIMFKRLEGKRMSVSDKNSIDLLIEQHSLGRKLVEKIIITSAKYFKGSTTEISNLSNFLSEFIKVYSEHINFEDEFFPKLSKYFSEDEKQNLITDFFKFNMKMVDEKYKSLLEMI